MELFTIAVGWLSQNYKELGAGFALFVVSSAWAISKYLDSRFAKQKTEILAEIQEFEQKLDQMVIDLQAAEDNIVENAHRLDLNENTVKTLRGIIEDFKTEAADMKKRSSNMEISLAKMLGALSRNFE